MSTGTSTRVIGLRDMALIASPLSQHPDHRGAFDEMSLQLGVAIEGIPTKGIYQSTDASFAALGLWIRALEACRATMVLMDQGMLGSAAATSRTAFECVFFAGALWKRPDLYERWLEGQQVDIQKQAKALRELKDYRALSEADRQLVDDRAHEKPTGNLDAHYAAKCAGLESLYVTGYRSLSTVGAHASKISLKPHIIGELENTLSMAPDLTLMPPLFSAVTHCLTVGSLLMQEHLGAFTPARPSPG